jgi:hypothetical protein
MPHYNENRFQLNFVPHPWSTHKVNSVSKYLSSKYLHIDRFDSERKPWESNSVREKFELYQNDVTFFLVSIRSLRPAKKHSKAKNDGNTWRRKICRELQVQDRREQWFDAMTQTKRVKASPLRSDWTLPTLRASIIQSKSRQMLFEFETTIRLLNLFLKNFHIDEKE